MTIGLRLAIPALLAVAAIPADAATLAVRVVGAKPSAGPVSVALCRGSLKPSDCRYGQRRRVRGPNARFSFQVPPGAYAVAVFQDENGNGRLDRNPLGLPTEPYAFSNDVGRTSAPSYNSARIVLGLVRGVVTVRLRRLGE